MRVRRRVFIGLLGGAAAWPVAARAQQPDRVRRVGVPIPIAADDPEAQARVTTFRAHLEQLGWTDKRNVQIDTRFGEGDTDRISEISDGIGCARARCHPGQFHSSPRIVVPADAYRSNRVYGRRRSCRSGLRRQPSAAGR